MPDMTTQDLKDNDANAQAPAPEPVPEAPTGGSADAAPQGDTGESSGDAAAPSSTEPATTGAVAPEGEAGNVDSLTSDAPSTSTSAGVDGTASSTDSGAGAAPEAGDAPNVAAGAPEIPSASESASDVAAGTAPAADTSNGTLASDQESILREEQSAGAAGADVGNAAPTASAATDAAAGTDPEPVGNVNTDNSSDTALPVEAGGAIATEPGLPSPDEVAQQSPDWVRNALPPDTPAAPPYDKSLGENPVEDVAPASEQVSLSSVIEASVQAGVKEVTAKFHATLSALADRMDAGLTNGKGELRGIIDGLKKHL